MSEPVYYTPETVEGACDRLAGDGRRTVVAGGQTLTLLLRQDLLEVDALVDVSEVPALSGVTVENGRARVGATTTYRELAAHDLASRVAMLGDACAVIGDPQIRTMGTVGGALGHADPAFDLPATLCCLDAVVDLASADGGRSVPIEEFLVGHMMTDLRPTEVIEAVRFALDPAGSAYEKHSRTGDGWATVGVAAAVTLADGRFEDVRVGLTAVADTAIRSPAVERALTGEPVESTAVVAASEAVVEDIDPLDDLSGSAAYKEELAPELVERAIDTAVERAGGER